MTLQDELNRPHLAYGEEKKSSENSTLAMGGRIITFPYQFRRPDAAINWQEIPLQ